ncbi:MAG: hypothetical protein PHC66_01860 [Candidatus Nanoarchaeia archaeon]|nr:hypothetical protein [Candidatus Nanoarchaeia archaeon]MDD5239033.1 hypothetical protein [Candidatus Nanoarchaeia archaeon]
MLYLAADGYCSDLIEMKKYINHRVNSLTELHIIDYLSRYSDMLLEEIVKKPNYRYVVIDNKLAYSCCKKKLSQMLTNIHGEYEMAFSMRIDDMNTLAELVAKQGLHDLETMARLGESCYSVSHIASDNQDDDVSAVGKIMAYSVLHSAFNRVFNFKIRNERGKEVIFNANTLSKCSKEICENRLYTGDETKERLISLLPKVLRDPKSIAYFETRLRTFSYQRVQKRKGLLEKFESGEISHASIYIKQDYAA